MRWRRSRRPLHVCLSLLLLTVLRATGEVQNGVPLDESCDIETAPEDQLQIQSQRSQDQAALGGVTEGVGGPVDATGAKGDDGTLDALAEEITELEALIKLQTHKLKALTSMRRRIQAGERQPAPEVMSSVLSPSASPELSDGFSNEDRTPHHEDYLITRGQLNLTDEGSVVRLITFQNVREGPRTYKHPKSNQLVYKMVTLVAVGDSKGTLTVYDLAGEVAAVYDTGHRAPITTIAFEGNEDPLLLTGASDGSLRLHNASLWRHDVMVAGKRPRVARASLTEGPGSSHVDSVRAVYLKPPEFKTTSGYGVILDCETELQRTEEAGQGMGHSAALVYRHRTIGRVAVTGDLEGTIRFHARNGSLVRTLHTNHPIYDMQKNSFLIAYTANRDVHFLGTFSMEPHPASCFGRHGALRSLAFDVLAPGILHASTEGGDVLVFDTKDRMLEDKATFPLIRKLTSPHGQPCTLSTMRGYLLSASSAGLTVYNVTHLREGPAHIHSAFHVSLPCHPSPPLLSASFAKITSELAPSFALSLRPSPDGPVEIHLIESLLPYRRPKPVDFLWVRGPIMAVVIMCIVVWQLVKIKSGGGSRRRGAGGDTDPLAGFNFNGHNGRFPEGLGDQDMDFIRSTIDDMRKEIGDDKLGLGGRKGPRSSPFGMDHRSWD